VIAIVRWPVCVCAANPRKCSGGVVKDTEHFGKALTVSSSVNANAIEHLTAIASAHLMHFRTFGEMGLGAH